MKKEYIIALLVAGIGLTLFLGRKKIKTVIMKILPIDTIKSLSTALDAFGITNPFLKAGIISEAYTESFLIPKSEMSYSTTPNSRLRQIFGKRLSNLSEDQLTALKKNDIEFFDLIYGGRYGNTSKGDGWKYRGRGLNQLTFKDAYKKYSKIIGVDIVKNPDLLNDENVAILALAAYFREGLNGMNLSNIKNLNQGTYIALQINAGKGTNINTPFFKEVLNKQRSVVDDIHKTIVA